MSCGHGMKTPNVFALNSETQRFVSPFSIWNARKLSDVLHTSTLQSCRPTRNKHLCLVYYLNVRKEELILSVCGFKAGVLL